ncbi:hypothetical protein G7046_g5358 [Stylonectria norvegica]|nr:hypothetical protein G7046_g5358 [Stylonectria norvegica]
MCYGAGYGAGFNSDGYIGDGCFSADGVAMRQLELKQKGFPGGALLQPTPGTRAATADAFFTAITTHRPGGRLTLVLASTLALGSTLPVGSFASETRLMLLRLGRPGFAMKRKLQAFLRDTRHSQLISTSSLKTTVGPASNLEPACKSASASTSASVSAPIMASSSTSTMATAAKIRLTPREQQLRRLLLDVAKSIDEAGHAPEPLVLRWAGGWVRDRLLDIESHDIDVAINAMTGVPFAQHMCDYCERPEAIVKHEIGPDDIGNLHNVARNPEKSKHLETAMVKMFGLDLDFVNLRRETYTEDSRNPQMEFGTAQEDALRRDATVNALFYNLHTDQVEDFTGGLPDMAAKVIRTPLEPFQTFMDDPLRVLRLVRFASRLQFTIQPATRNFMGNPDVLEALRLKISRERVGVELEKMLKGEHPRNALQLIDELKLYPAIFTDPAHKDLPTPDITRWSVPYMCLDELMQQRPAGSIYSMLIRTDDAAYTAWNLAAVSPWMAMDSSPDARRKASAPPLVAVVAREGFKAPNKLSDVISASYRHRREILELKRAVCAKEPWVNERDRFGMAIRRWDAQVGSWRLQALSAMLVEAMEVLQEWPKVDSEVALGADDGSKQHAYAEREAFLAGWHAFLDHLTKLDVYDAPSMKRLLDGHQLAQALGIKPGKWMGKAIEVCVAWQLRNPNETDTTAAIEEVRQRHKELGIVLA